MHQQNPSEVTQIQQRHTMVCSVWIFVSGWSFCSKSASPGKHFLPFTASSNTILVVVIHRFCIYDISGHAGLTIDWCCSCETHTGWTNLRLSVWVWPNSCAGFAFPRFQTEADCSLMRYCTNYWNIWPPVLTVHISLLVSVCFIPVKHSEITQTSCFLIHLNKTTCFIHFYE